MSNGGPMSDQTIPLVRPASAGGARTGAPTLSRSAFLRGGGALVVGFSLAAESAFPAAGAGPGLTAATAADPSQVDSWLRVNADNTVNLLTSQIEVGNGITTGFLQVLAEEMGMEMRQMIYGSSIRDRLGAADTSVDTDLVLSTGGEGGSNAMAGTGGRIRAAGAVAYQALLQLAAVNLGLPVSQLTVAEGVVSGAGKSVSYGELVGGKLLGAQIPVAASNILQGMAGAKPPSAYTLVTRPLPRIDIPDKVTGRYTYVHNLRVPGMLHGRWVRPRGQGPYLTPGFATPVAVDPGSIAHLPDVRVVQVGQFIGVVAPWEYTAVEAAALLKVTWADSPILPGNADRVRQVRAADSSGLVPARIVASVGDFPTAFASAAKTVSASFYASDRGHNPIGPGCAIAIYGSGPGGDTITVYGNTQNVEACAQDLASVFGVPLANVRVVFYEGSSSFGNGWHAFDIAEAAALLSRAVEAPVRLQLMRWDEQGWTRYGQAFLTDLQGGIDAQGNIVAYSATQTTQPSTVLPATGQLALGLTPPPLGLGMPNTENLAPFYSVSVNAGGAMGYQVVGKTIGQPLGVFQSGTLRAPSGPQTAFASEQFVDMLAIAAGMDPLAFRLQNIRGDGEFPRWATALQTAAANAGYRPRISGSKLSQERLVTGMGMAIGTHNSSYAAAVARVQVDRRTGRASVLDLWAAQDSGLAVNPGLIENQMSGNLVQGTSVALVEELAYSTHRVTSVDWVTYPILRFRDAPRVHTTVIQRTDQPSTGSGEPPQVPVVPAIANAIFDATGVRMWKQPMTAGYVRGRLKQEGRAD
jgi:nicotinate dehydrogenase subunit B